jgi:hypothetical protein
MRLLSLLLVAALSTPSMVSARDLFVNNLGGNDLLTGRTPYLEGRENGPVQTINAALRRSLPGDRIVLADTGVPYQEVVTVQAGRNSGVSSLMPLVIDGGGAILDGSVPIPDDAWEHVSGDVFRYAPEIKSHQVLLLEGRPALRVPTERGQIDLPPLGPLQWCLVGGYIYFRVEPTRLPPHYLPACAGAWTGITLYDVHDVVLRNIVIRGFAFDGVNAHDNAFNVRLEEVLVRDNGRSGISIGGASRVRVERCEATFNHAAQLRVEGHSVVHLSDNVLDETTAPALEHTGGRLVVEDE